MRYNRLLSGGRAGRSCLLISLSPFSRPPTTQQGNSTPQPRYPPARNGLLASQCCNAAGLFHGSPLPVKGSLGPVAVRVLSHSKASPRRVKPARRFSSRVISDNGEF